MSKKYVYLFCFSVAGRGFSCKRRTFAIYYF